MENQDILNKTSSTITGWGMKIDEKENSRAKMKFYKVLTPNVANP